MEVLNSLAEMVVQDLSYNRMADALNQKGFRTRTGTPWTPLAVFKLTPRLIEVAPSHPLRRRMGRPQTPPNPRRLELLASYSTLSQPLRQLGAAPFWF